MNKKLWIFGTLAVCILTTVISLYKLKMQNLPQPVERPNFLILSFCSLRKEELPFFGANARPLPNIEHFFRGGLLFRNAINGLPWTNFTNTVEFSWLEDMGFVNKRKRKVRIPQVPINQNAVQNKKYSVSKYEVRTYELNYKEDLVRLDRVLTQMRLPSPFYISVHFKYLHFPYIDPVNQPERWRKDFSPTSVRLLTQYLAHPEKYPEKSALLLTLFSDPHLVRQSPYAKKYIEDFSNVRMGQIYQVLSDRDLLAAWKQSPDFSDDLKMLSEAYYLKLKELDNNLSPVLSVAENGNLGQRTIVVFTGDHGEALFEHDDFLHANTVTDEQLKTPLAIRDSAEPARATPLFIDEQYDIKNAKGLVKVLSENGTNVKAIRTFLHKECQNVFLQNCQGSVRGVRSESGYKLLIDQDEWKLIDLKADPYERADVKAQHTDEYLNLKETYFKLEAEPRQLLACEEHGMMWDVSRSNIGQPRPLPRFEMEKGKPPIENSPDSAREPAGEKFDTD